MHSIIKLIAITVVLQARTMKAIGQAVVEAKQPILDCIEELATAIEKGDIKKAMTEYDQATEDSVEKIGQVGKDLQPALKRLKKAIRSQKALTNGHAQADA